MLPATNRRAGLPRQPQHPACNSTRALPRRTPVSQKGGTLVIDTVVIPTYEVPWKTRRDSLGKLEKMRPCTELEKWDGSFDDWQARGEALSKGASDHQWEIAEWIARGDRSFRSQAYDVAEALTGYSRATLQQWASVYRGCFIRIKELSFGHHQVVAALPAELQRQALEYALANKLSVAQLRREIKKALGGQQKLSAVSAIKTERMPVEFSKDEFLCIRQWARACGCTESRIVHDIVFEWYRLGGLGLPAHLRRCNDDE